MRGAGSPSSCRVAGHCLAYHELPATSEARGSVLLLHGIVTYSFIWRRIAPRLAIRHRVVTPDLLGCGDSEKPEDADYSCPAQARLVAGLIEKLGLAPVHLVGHDVGGAIAQLLAVERPELVRDLVLLNTVGYDYWPVQPIVALRTPIVRQLLMATLDLGTFRLLVRRGLYRKQRLTNELMELFWRPYRTREGRRALVRFARSLDHRDLMAIVPRLRELRLPALILRGEADPFLSSAISERLARDLRGSRLVRLPEAGHFAQEDDPERIAELALDFFAEVEGG